MIDEYTLNRFLGDLYSVCTEAESAATESKQDMRVVIDALTETVRFLCKEISDQL